MKSLERFVEAQEKTHEKAMRELRRGLKVSHWMWWTFPQIRGLGESKFSHIYGIRSLREAEAYMEHPVLSSRLIEATGAVVDIEGKVPTQIFGGIDAMKFRSCMTLFYEASRREFFDYPVQKLYNGRHCTSTRDILYG